MIRSSNLLVILIGLLVSSCSTNKVCIRGHCFRIETADTPAQQEMGLMYREHLDEDSGMLFVFPEGGIHGFWMKNTKIPLDILWIKGGKIKYISRNTQPCASECPIIRPNISADYVLEISGGLCEKYDIDVGDQVSGLSLTNDLDTGE